MSKFDPASMSLRTAISLALTSAGLMLPAHMAIAQDAAAQDTQELEEVVVTGFRGSLNTALGQKREALPPSTASSPKTSANSPTATSPNRCSASPA